jgi:2,3-bisphosphoglycerate-dependent phosphoglycerate mutase
MAYLVFVRHGQSEWNALGQWTGLTDISLSETGKKEAREAAQHLHDITLHKAYVSDLKRTHETLDEIKAALTDSGIPAKELPTEVAPALNERDYGDYTGKNKWQAQEEMGEEAFTKLRRTWDHPVPNGETLKDVHARALPYFEEHIITDLKAGKNVIVAGHGNTLRALIKHLDNVPDDKVHEVEIGTAGVVVYEIDDNGAVIKKDVRSTGSKA